MSKDLYFSFNKENPMWDTSIEINQSFIRFTLAQLEAIYRVRGYMYLNQIYEHLGYKWNPDDDNTLYRCSIDGFNFKYSSIEESETEIKFRITIR